MLDVALASEENVDADVNSGRVFVAVGDETLDELDEPVAVVVKESMGRVRVAVNDDTAEKLAEDVLVADNVITGTVLVEVDECVAKDVVVLNAENVLNAEKVDDALADKLEEELVAEFVGLSFFALAVDKDEEDEELLEVELAVADSVLKDD